jgi:acetate kinase
VDDLRTVTVHLGGGASAAAVRGGRSVDTTMGFTPLDGMVMATRPGSVDPGAVLAALRAGTDLERLGRELRAESGMAGLAGGEHDLRRLYARIDHGDDDARLAVAVHVRSVAHGVAAMATALDRVDALAFTGGAGAGSARLRHEVVARLAPLGVVLDTARNQAAATAEGDGDVADALVHGAGSAWAVAVVVPREATVIARAARAVGAASGGVGPPGSG